MHDDEADAVPGWILPFFADRPLAEFEAWWDAVRRLYGPLGVRMDFRAVTAPSADPIEPARLLAS